MSNEHPTAEQSELVMIDQKHPVLIIEPFLSIPTLPCLGPATLCATLKSKGLSCEILYPALEFFCVQKLYLDPNYIALAEDIPLQLMEMLFQEGPDPCAPAANDPNTEKSIGEKADISELAQYQGKLAAFLTQYAQKIRLMDPSIVCFSLTFGDFNFALALSKRIKCLCSSVAIVYGGSSFSVSLANQYVQKHSEVDYIVCDETGETLAELCRELLQSAVPNGICAKPFVASRCDPATELRTVQRMDLLPCPDFGDFIRVSDASGIDRSRLTLPYEIARGCWWAERKPCNMCGFFGLRKKYIVKNPAKVASELQYMNETYGIDRIRFTDLVQPEETFLKQLRLLLKPRMKFFFELRPGLSRDELYLMWQLGVTKCQVGLESLQTKALSEMNKGTTGIENLRMLRDLTSIGIKAYWNYLYGFAEDTEQDYLCAISLFRKLHHLYPPVARKVWINRYSPDYDRRKDTLVAFNEDAHKDIGANVDVFFREAEDETPKPYHVLLQKEILAWKAAFDCGEKAFYYRVGEQFFVYRRHGDETKTIRLDRTQGALLELLLMPRTDAEMRDLCDETGKETCSSLETLIDAGYVVHYEGSYITIVTALSESERILEHCDVICSPQYLFEGNVHE